jgi:PBSX family phage portal protein
MANNRKRMPFAFGTSNGRVVTADVLKEYQLEPHDKPEDVEDVFSKKYKIKDLPTKKERQMALKGSADSTQEPSKGLTEMSAITTYGLYNLMTPPFNPRVLANLGTVNTYHNVCCRKKATDVAGLGFTLEPIGEDPNQDHFDTLLAFFNASSPTFENMLSNAQQDYEQVGWGIVELIRTGGLAQGLPQRLNQLPSQTFRIHKEKNKFMQSWWGFDRRWFKMIGYQNDVDMNTGEEYELGELNASIRANEVIYNTNYSSFTTYYGMPPHIPAIRTIIGDQAAVDYNVAFFRNFGIPSYAIFVTGNFEDNEVKDEQGEGTGQSELQMGLEKQLKNIIGNPQSSMVVAIPSGDADTAPVQVTFEKLAADVKESSFRLYRMDNRDEIIVAHEMDPYRVGIVQVGGLGGNIAPEAAINYKVGTIKPRQRVWEAFINKHIIWDEFGFNFDDYSFKLQEMETDSTSKEDEINNFQNLFNMSAITPLQVISHFADELNIEITPEMKAMPCLNTYYIPNNMVSLQQAFEGSDIMNKNFQATADAQTEKMADMLQEVSAGILEVVDDYDFENSNAQKNSSQDGRLGKQVKKIFEKAAAK